MSVRGERRICVERVLCIYAGWKRSDLIYKRLRSSEVSISVVRE